MSKITILKMPSLSPTMKTGNLIRWNIKIGDSVKLGQVIAEIETDKASMDMESPASGVFSKILIDGGSNDVNVDTPIGVLAPAGAAESDIDAELGKFKTAQAPAEQVLDRVGGYKKPQIPEPAPTVLHSINTTVISQAVKENKRIIISPYAKNVANTHNLGNEQISNIVGTGPRDMIVAKDIQAFLNKLPAVDSVSQTSRSTVNTMSSMRKAISRKVVHSKQTVPHFYVSAEINISEIEKAKEQLFSKYEIKTTLNDWFILACAKALKKYPQLNQVWQEEGESLIQFNHVDINCAIDVGYGPLLVLLKDADSKTLIELRDELRNIVSAAKEKATKPEQLATGTFSISNLGMFQVSSFSAIINPPQVAVLAVGAGRDGWCTFTVSCDHRVLDGRDAALFLQELRKMIETPFMML